MAQVVKKQYVSRNGEWVEVALGSGGGGTAPNEVLIGATGPSDPEVELWLDSTEDPVPLDAVTKTQADTDYVNVTGDTMTGPLTIADATTGATLLNLEAISGKFAGIRARMVGVGNRWFYGKDDIAETGSNAGSNFVIRRYDDTGLLIPPHNALEFNRATGLGTVAGDPTAPLGIATKAYVDRDTGPRNIASLLVNGWLPGDGFTIQRIGSQVQLTLGGIYNQTLGAAEIVLDLPEGFRPNGYLAVFTTYDLYNIAPDVATVLRYPDAVGWKLRPLSGGANYRHYSECSWFTGEPWPTSLPGAPVTLDFWPTSLPGSQP